MVLRPFPFDRLPKVSNLEQALISALYAQLPFSPGREWGTVARALGGPLEIEVQNVALLSRRALAEAFGATMLELQLGPSRTALLLVDPRLGPRLCRTVLGFDASDELPLPRPLTRVEQGALQLLVEAYGGEAAGRVEIAARGLSPEATETTSLALSARLRSSVGEGWLLLLVPASAALWPPLKREWSDVILRSHRLESSGHTVPIELARTPLLQQELSGLGRGDVVLFESAPARETSMRGALRVGHGGFSVRLDVDRIFVESFFRLFSGGRQMASELEGGANGNEVGAVLLGELPVELACELGRVTMSGRELLELGPGSVISTGRPLRGPVDLTVGGRLVARGELVDIEGVIGVRITEMER